MAAAPAMAATPRTIYSIAQEGLQRAGNQISHKDVVAIADFSAPSRAARFHLVDMASGRVSSHLVSHGRGSDPVHSGWVKHFSNTPNSNATSEGLYRTDNYYVGKHGRSQRLIGLEPWNDNALSRAIVIHGAAYVNDKMASATGKIGRSQGCFAFDPSNESLDEVMARIGPGRLLYAGRLSVTA